LKLFGLVKQENNVFVAFCKNVGTKLALHILSIIHNYMGIEGQKKKKKKKKKRKKDIG
jgi:hypothetical protein